MNFRANLAAVLLCLLCSTVVGGQNYVADFALERPKALPSIKALEVMCGKDHMSVQVAFTSPFQGMVFSKGQYGNPSCMYVNPRTGGSSYDFTIHYNQCGTKPDMGGKFYENTIIVQYDSDLIEVWDEAKRLRCEWYNDYEKTASKPPMVIADLEVVELNFRGDNVDCWMEIQDGKGPWATPITGIVPLGSTLTMVIAINDHAGEFDMRVKNCEASDGLRAPIYLSDKDGCVLRPKMISRFMKLRNNDGRATVITYAHFHAFKFPDSMSVHLRCKVEICRYGCPDHCQKPTAGNPIGNYANRESSQGLIDNSYGSSSNINAEFLKAPQAIKRNNPAGEADNTIRRNDLEEPSFIADQGAAQKYKTRTKLKQNENIELPHSDDFPWGPRSLRRRREEVSPSRHARSADIGVNVNYQVISEADLEFTPTREEGITVFKGQREGVVYGVCLPAPSFSALFVLLAMCTVISVLVAGFMCHHRQIQKDSAESPAVPHSHQMSPLNMVHFLRSQLGGVTH